MSRQLRALVLATAVAVALTAVQRVQSALPDRPRADGKRIGLARLSPRPCWRGRRWRPRRRRREPSSAAWSPARRGQASGC